MTDTIFGAVLVLALLLLFVLLPWYFVVPGLCVAAVWLAAVT